jgi:formylglycine-generating enzyme required for sulfatase activity
VKGLRGEAAGPDGLVTFQDLVSYVTLSVRPRGLETGCVQVPYEAGEASGDFLLARAPAGGIIDRGPQPGSTKVNAKDGQRYIWIPPRSFIMGCSPGDTECFDREKPAHNVSITKAFWLGQTPVTQGAYRHFKTQM